MKHIILSLVCCLALANTVFGETLSEQLNKRKAESRKGIDSRSLKIMKIAQEKIIKAGVGKDSIKVGKKVPEFALQSSGGGLVKLSTLYKKGPLVLKFYRGAWCPYCRIELLAYEKMHADFVGAGARLVAATPDMFSEIRKMKKELKIGFLILKDQNNELASKFGLSFTLPKELEKLYKQFGINVKKSTGQAESNLPIPGTYVIDSKGIVRYAFAEVDYTKRAEPSEVLKVVKNLKKGKKKK